MKGKGQGKRLKIQLKIQKKGIEKAKRQVLQESNETSASDVGTDDLCQDDEDDDAEDTGNRCLVCDEFGKNNETVVRMYLMWAMGSRGVHWIELSCDMC